MRHAVTIAALVLTVAVSACATGAKEPGFTREDQDAIRKNAVDLAAAFNAKEVDKVIGFYADNSIFMPPNAPLLRGRDPLKSFYSDLIAKGATDLRLEPEEVSGYGPIAYESGTYSVTFANGASRDRGKYLLVLRNMGGTWRTEKTIWSSDLPPSPAHAD
jgi:ketosteroid isomerase-like protein